MLEDPVKHVRGGAETMHADMGRLRPGGDFFDVAVGYRRPAEAAAADYRFHPENSQDSARRFLRCCRLARKLLAAITSPT